jgi:hypothetical protein
MADQGEVAAAVDDTYFLFQQDFRYPQAMARPPEARIGKENRTLRNEPEDASQDQS